MGESFIHKDDRSVDLHAGAYSVGWTPESVVLFYFFVVVKRLPPFPETDYQKVKCFGHVRKRRTKVYRYVIHLLPFLFFFFKFHL